MDQPVTERRLIAVARGRMSSEQLKRWRREGLLPRPEQIHVPGVRGSQSRYPAGTPSQLRTVLKFKQRYHRLDELRFWLWWEECWVEPTALRSTLAKLLGEELTDFLGVGKSPRARARKAEAMGEAVAASNGRSPLLRLLRQRLGGDDADLATLFTTFAQLSLGDEPVWENTLPELAAEERAPEEIASDAMGLGRLTTEKHDELGPLATEKPAVQDLFEQMRVAGLFPIENLPTVLAHAAEDELQQAREDARFIVDDLGVIAEALEIAFGRDAFGLGISSLYRKQGPQAVGRRVLTIAGALCMRRGLVDPETFDLIAQQARLVVPTAREFVAENRKRKT
jgi:hypothetical protein